ncbi:hypothetical protein GCM10023331_08450 [Algivirga pacifica]|uniref:HTH LytTR-type domain-containing protein n=2 Tax=Algivirga pacifica TaxID=1162670 RepID=A0ABP9D9K4_9BACT
MLVIVLSYVLLSNYSYEQMSPMASDVFTLTITLYFIVFLFSFILLVRQSIQQQTITQSVEEKNTNPTEHFLNIRSNRKNYRITPEDIIYVESLSDYIHIHLKDDSTLKTHEKISHFHKQLPASFLRIHRSFIVNPTYITAYNKETLVLKEQELPISRTYKKAVIKVLNEEKR